MIGHVDEANAIMPINKLIKDVQLIKESGKMEIDMEREKLFILIGHFIKETLRMIRNMERENTIKLMDQLTKIINKFNIIRQCFKIKRLVQVLIQAHSKTILFY
jgi:hypothetical protein